MDILELSSILRDNGIVGAGGAGFPTYAKLSKDADTIILNCAECEPLLKLHRQLLKEHCYEILKAFSMMADAVEAEKAIIGIKEEYASTIVVLEEVMRGFPNITLHKLPSTYPTGDEVVLIYETTGRVVRPGGIPIENKVTVFNVETVYNVYQAVYNRQAVINKYVTIVGEVEHPVTVQLPIGTSIKEAVKCAGEITIDQPVFLVGGPMMGNIMAEDQVITKTTNAIIVLPSNHPLIVKKKVQINRELNRAASSCCQCQTCTDLCPRNALGHPIKPHLFMRAVANRDTHQIEPFINTLFCSSCGLCEMYSCPQGLSPRSIMAAYKVGLRKEGIKPPVVAAKEVNAAREYRRVPEARLMSRLGLEKYNRDAPLEDKGQSIKYVKVKLSQHIGAPSIACVSPKMQVKQGDIIAKPSDGLSVGIHSPIDGEIMEVTKEYIAVYAG